MIKVTARAYARATSSFTHFAFSIVQNEKRERRVCCSLLDPHTQPRPSGYGSPIVTERYGDNNTNPKTDFSTTKRSTRRVVPVPNVC